jgi:hypothetical protein
VAGAALVLAALWISRHRLTHAGLTRDPTRS